MKTVYFSATLLSDAVISERAATTGATAAWITCREQTCLVLLLKNFIQVT